MIINVLDLIWLFYPQFYLVINVEVIIIQVCAPENKTHSNGDNPAFPISSVVLVPLGRVASSHMPGSKERIRFGRFRSALGFLEAEGLTGSS